MHKRMALGKQGQNLGRKILGKCMSGTNPFRKDEKIRLRCEELTASVGAELCAETKEILQFQRKDKDAGLFLASEDCQALILRHGLDGIDALMLLLLPLSKDYAVPPISNFYVGAIGLEAETGGLLFGGNMEFPGTHMGLTIHGETFLAARVFSRGTSLRQIALGEAHPCGHCRQFLSEFASAPGLRLIDPLGHNLGLADLLPWPFDPGYLGEPGAIADHINWPSLSLPSSGPMSAALVAAGRKAHAPYSKNPAAAVCVMQDGSHVTGASFESVAFNPSMGPLQTAIVNLTAHGYLASDNSEIHVAETRSASFSHLALTQILAKAFAPHAGFRSVHWEG